MRTAIRLLPVLAILVPASGALPPACADPCTVVATNAGYVPPAVSLADGAHVRWSSIDAPHPTTEAFADDPCFLASTSASAGPSAWVRFDVVGAALQATVDPDGPTPTAKTCAQAQGLGDGSFLLVYHCTLHPQMWGALVVGP